MAAAGLFDRVDQGRQPLNPHLQTVARLDRSDPAGCAGEDDVARQQRHVGGYETD